MKTSPGLANSNQDSMQEEWREGKQPRVELVGLRALRGWCFGQLGVESRKKDPYVCHVLKEKPTSPLRPAFPEC